MSRVKPIRPVGVWRKEQKYDPESGDMINCKIFDEEARESMYVVKKKNVEEEAKSALYGIEI